MPRTSRHIYGCRISDEWTLKGMRAAVLENEQLRVVMLLDKGAEIIEFRYKPLDLDPLLRRPVELRNPERDRPTRDTGGSNFVDYYIGGWQEILPNGGPPAIYKGAEYGQHGEVSLVPWQSEVIEDTPERVSLRCSVHLLRTPLWLQRTMTLERGQATLQIDETLVNESDVPVDLMWGHHIAFGLPFLHEGANIDTSATVIQPHTFWPGMDARRLVPDVVSEWPHAPANDGTIANMSVVLPEGQARGQEVSYLSEFGDHGWYAITNPDLQAGFALRWDANIFKYVWLWQEFAEGDGYPWWKQTYTVALEPWTSSPQGLDQVVAQGKHLTIGANETINTRLVATAYSGVRRVADVNADGSVVAKTD